MCMCVECVGDLPEPVDVEENGRFAIFYKDEKLTDWHETKELAYAEFDHKYQ